MGQALRDAEIAKGRIVPRPKPLTDFQKKRAKLKKKQIRWIENEDRKLERYATKIVGAALRTPELADLDPDVLNQHWREGTVPEGWTRRELKIAMDANLPIKQQPGYIPIALRLKESFHRSEEKAPPAPVLNAEKVVLQLNQYNYKVTNLDEEEK